MEREITDSRSNHNFVNGSAESNSVVSSSPERPKALRVDTKGIPTELKNIPRWINWELHLIVLNCPQVGKTAHSDLHSV